ncbi:unnamed protein product [Staurois parvus]|uniref:Uncharacterized protein n=1 Tax=Staurois parvus TaxID=386267 RepID=A0ABN9EW51_9NEOB|nr:unnamed protein product [Staurois parvus]
MAQALRGTTVGQCITQAVCAHNRDSSGHGWSVHTVGQFGTRVVGAHSGDSSGHEWSVHTAGTVQDTSGQCTQQTQFRTQVVSAHNNRDSSGHSR